MEDQKIKRSRRTSAEIKQLLEAFSRAAISAKEFCMQHDISEACFYKWRSRYGGSPSENKNDFVILKQTSVSVTESTLFAEVNGIRIYQPVTASYLKELL
jgi:hypothetical protein